VAYRISCPECAIVGFVRAEHVITRGVSITAFYCGKCGHHWQHRDSPLTKSKPNRLARPMSTVSTISQAQPDLARMNRSPTHPGAILLNEFLEPAGVSQRQAAIRMKMSSNRLSEIVLGKRGVTPETAILFGLLTKTDPRLWLQLQQDRDLWHAARKMKSRRVDAIV
jgi:antitoxin HigA-1